MIPWKQAPPREVFFKVGPCELSVKEGQPAGQQWQYIRISFGEFSESPLEECLTTWPQRAIQLARKAIGELERKLKELDS